MLTNNVLKPMILKSAKLRGAKIAKADKNNDGMIFALVVHGNGFRHWRLPIPLTESSDE